MYIRWHFWFQIASINERHANVTHYCIISEFFFAFFHSVADKVEVKGYFLTEILPHNLQMSSYSGQTIKV